MIKRLNLHIDEAGNQDLSEGLYIVAIVLHEHSLDVNPVIDEYERQLLAAGLTDIPFHGKDLLYGKEEYRNISAGDRKRLLTQFSRFIRLLPFAYFTLIYNTSDVRNKDVLQARIRRDLASLIYDHLTYFQTFDMVAVYYDNGQNVVRIALHDAFDFMLAKNITCYKEADHGMRRFLQAADYICTIERALIAYNTGKQTKTQERFFGNRRNFMRSFMKQLTAKRFC